MLNDTQYDCPHPYSISSFYLGLLSSGMTLETVSSSSGSIPGRPLFFIFSSDSVFKGLILTLFNKTLKVSSEIFLVYSIINNPLCSHVNNHFHGRFCSTNLYSRYIIINLEPKQVPYKIMNSSHSFELNPGSPSRDERRRPSKRIKILFEDHLPQEYLGLNLPNELAQKRNWTIRALYLQCLATFTGFCIFFLRRVYYSHFDFIKWYR